MSIDRTEFAARVDRRCDRHGEHTSKTGCPKCRSETIRARRSPGGIRTPAADPGPPPAADPRPRRPRKAAADAAGPVTPRQYALALVAPGPRGDRLLGYLAPSAVLGRYVALDGPRAAKWATVAEPLSWLDGRPPCVLQWLAAGCRAEPVGLVTPGGGAPCATASP
jgi:hypothetical protein